MGIVILHNSKVRRNNPMLLRSCEQTWNNHKTACALETQSDKEKKKQLLTVSFFKKCIKPI